MKFAGKQIELEKNYSEVSQSQKHKYLVLFAYMWIFAVKLMIIKL